MSRIENRRLLLRSIVDLVKTNQPNMGHYSSVFEALRSVVIDDLAATDVVVHITVGSDKPRSPYAFSLDISAPDE